jgi:phage terminase small subunit
MALTGRARVFADAVFGGLSNKQAAIHAGYSPATASAAGARLVKDKRVALYLAEKRAAPAPPPPDALAPPVAAGEYSDPMQFLRDQMNDDELDIRQRLDAAKALMPYVHPKLGEGGKKNQTAEAAKKVAIRFAPAAPPKLAAVGGKKV